MKHGLNYNQQELRPPIRRWKSMFCSFGMSQTESLVGCCPNGDRSGTQGESHQPRKEKYDPLRPWEADKHHFTSHTLLPKTEATRLGGSSPARCRASTPASTAHGCRAASAKRSRTTAQRAGERWRHVLRCGSSGSSTAKGDIHQPWKTADTQTMGRNGGWTRERKARKKQCNFLL